MRVLMLVHYTHTHTHNEIVKRSNIAIEKDRDRERTRGRMENAESASFLKCRSQNNDDGFYAYERYNTFISSPFYMAVRLQLQPLEILSQCLLLRHYYYIGRKLTVTEFSKMEMFTKHRHTHVNRMIENMRLLIRLLLEMGLEFTRISVSIQLSDLWIFFDQNIEHAINLWHIISLVILAHSLTQPMT